MEVLSSPNITRAAARRPRKRGRKRSVRTSGNAKQRAQAKKRKRTAATSKTRSDNISGETINVVATIEPSLVSSNCNAEAAKKEGKETHELAPKVADSLYINCPIDNDESLIDGEIVKLFTTTTDGSFDEEISSQYDLRPVTDAELEHYLTSEMDHYEYQEIDEDYFLDMTNEIFETIPAPQKSLILEETSIDEEINDDEFVKRLLEAINDDTLLDIRHIDKDYFLEVSNKIYESMATSQKSLLLLLLAEGSESCEQSINDKDLAEMLLEAIDEDGWLKIHTVDKEHFLEVAEEVYETMSEAQKLFLLGGPISFEQDYNDSRFVEMMLAAIDDQHGIDAVPSPTSSTTSSISSMFRTPPPLDPVSSLDDLDTIMLNSSGSDLSCS